MKNKMNKKVAALAVFAALTASASAQDAAALSAKFTTAITGQEDTMWTLGAVVAGFVAVVVVIGLIIRGAKKVSSSS